MSLLNLGLPDNCIYNQFIPKKQFYTHGEFSQADKNIFINGIERITLYAQLTRENSNINKYKDELKTYDEISIFLIELKNKKEIEKIAQLVLASVPYPVILIGKYADKYICMGAHQRDNKVDNNKIILEKMYYTDFLDKDSLHLKNVSYKNFNKLNFYAFYDDYIQYLINYNLEKRNIEEVENKEEILSEIERLENQITLLKNQMKRERHFNKKMELNIKIKNKEQKLKSMEA